MTNPTTLVWRYKDIRHVASAAANGFADNFLSAFILSKEPFKQLVIVPNHGALRKADLYADGAFALVADIKKDQYFTKIQGDEWQTTDWKNQQQIVRVDIRKPRFMILKDVMAQFKAAGEPSLFQGPVPRPSNVVF